MDGRIDGKFTVTKGQGLTQAIASELNLTSAQCKKMGSVWTQILDKVKEQNDLTHNVYSGGSDIKGPASQNFVVKAGSEISLANVWKDIVDLVNNALGTSIVAEDAENQAIAQSGIAEASEGGQSNPSEIESTPEDNQAPSQSGGTFRTADGVVENSPASQTEASENAPKQQPQAEASEESQAQQPHIEAQEETVSSSEEGRHDTMCDSPDCPENTRPKFHFRGSAKDIPLLDKRGASHTVNDPSGKAQFVLGDEDGEVHIRCPFDVHDDEDAIDRCTNDDPSKAGYVLITDNTNSKKNTYKYRRLEASEIEAGQTRDGQPLTKSQFEDEQAYFVLESVVDEFGDDLMAHDHVEVYRLDYSADEETNTYTYDLIQEEGMDGAGVSSMDFFRRAR